MESRQRTLDLRTKIRMNGIAGKRFILLVIRLAILLVISNSFERSLFIEEVGFSDGRLRS